MHPIKECNVNSGQHFWVQLPKVKGMQCYSCPMCGQLVYWSDTILGWVKPPTSGNRVIKGNVPTQEGSEG